MTHGYADPDGLDEASRRALEIGADVLGALHVVLHRLASRTSDSPTCTSTAQELAFRALVNTAGLFLDEDADVDDLRDFYEDHVEDTDVELLFDQALDGLEEPSDTRGPLRRSISSSTAGSTRSAGRGRPPPVRRHDRFWPAEDTVRKHHCGSVQVRPCRVRASDVDTLTPPRTFHDH